MKANSIEMMENLSKELDSTDRKLCKDCRWKKSSGLWIFDDSAFWRCVRPNPDILPSPVDGAVRKQYMRCSNERFTSFGCGQGAKYFEPKEKQGAK